MSTFCPRLFQLTVHKLRCLDASLSWISAERTLCHRSCVCLTHFQQCTGTEGPCGAQKEATPAACVSAPLRRQSVSQLTIPLCYRSSWPLFLLQDPEPPVFPPAKGPHAWGPAGAGSGANAGFWSDSSYSLAISALLSFSLGRRSQSRGARASWRESAVVYCKHMCVTYVWNEPRAVHILSAFCLTDKAHFTLHKMEWVVWFNMVKQYSRFQKWFAEWENTNVLL